MDVRVCGPNLRDQSKGTFHVHRDGCADLRKYGPQYSGPDAKGGDTNGNCELLIDNATVEDVVSVTYSDQLAESNGDWEDYVSDFWFAPCCSDMHAIPYEALPYPGEVVVVYECWMRGEGISHESSAFLKTKDLDERDKWVARWVNSITPGQSLVVSAHDEKEYRS